MIDKSGSLNVSDAFHAPTFERNILTVARGGSITFVGKVFLAICRFVTAILLARLLGAEQYGLYNLAISAGALATGVALLGLDTAVVRYVAISASRRDEAGLWGALQVSLGISILLSVLASIGLFALAYPIAEYLFHEPKLVPLLQLMGLVVPFLTLSDMLAGANRGFKKMEYPVIAQSIAQPMIRLILIVVLAFAGLNATHAVVIYGLADCAASGIMLYFLHRQFSLRRPLREARRDTRAILSFSLPDWLAGLMVRFRNNVQTVLLGSLNTIASVGIFTVAAQLTSVGGMFYASINTSAKPIIAELHDRGDREQLRRLYQTATKWSVMLNLPMFLAMMLFPGVLLSVFGEGFVGGATALMILAFADLVNVGTGMCGSILEMTGYTRLKLVNSIVRLVLILVLDLLLIPHWGIVGAAVAVLAGESTVNLLRLLEVFILFRLLPYSWNLLKPLAAAALALVCTLAIGRWLPAEAASLVVVLQSLVMLAVYIGATLALGLAPEERAVLARLYRRARALLPRS